MRFSQVLGSFDNSSSIVKDDPSYHLANNNGQFNANDTQNIKIERSELQKKRAQHKNSFTHHLGSRYINTLPFFGGRQTTQTDSNKKEAVVTDLVHLPLSTTSPINLARQCIDAQIEKDNSVPTLYEILSMYIVDNYNFNPNQKSNPFSRFEKINHFGIPNTLLGNNNDSLVTNMGILPEIQRAWMSVDSKLYIWNFNASLTDQEFDVIDDFDGTILTCALSKPKENVFVKSVTNLLIVATSKEMKILALEYDSKLNSVQISDTKLSLPVHGLIVNKIISFDSTNDILFTGAGSGDAIWRLNYSHSNDWFSKSVTKELLTDSFFGSAFQNIPLLNWFNDSTSPRVESILDIKIDQTRNILYTLSSKSVIRSYKIQKKDTEISLGQPLIKKVTNLLKELSTTAANIRSPLLRNNLKLINIFPVSKNENPNLFLVVVASNGCRFFINGSTLYGDRLNLTTNFVKFPPIDMKLYETIEKRKEKLLNENDAADTDLLIMDQDLLTKKTPYYNYGKNSQPTVNSFRATDTSYNNSNFNNDKSITKSVSGSLISIDELKEAQERSQILHGTTLSLLISPGIFIGYTKELGLYTSVPDYGIFKKASQYVEDFEVHEKFADVFDIVQLTKSFNATDTPKGYANEFASQYTSEPLEFAVLSSSGITIYRYRTPDLILEDSMNDKVFQQFSSKYGSDEACSSALYLACKYDKPQSFRNIATKYFLSGGKNPRLDKSMSPVIDNVEPSDRFYAILILFARLIRRFWNKEVFRLRPEIKFDKFGYIDIQSVKLLKTEKNLILEGLNISKTELEYLLCSILIILKFFDDNKNVIPGLSKDINTQSESTSWKEKANEVCVQAEQICFDSISKFLNIVKEGLSFLAILMEEVNVVNKSDFTNFKSIIAFLPIQLQADLSCLTFSDFFAKSDENVSKLVKELLSCIINKSISEGNSVELVANTLQEKCGHFCSTGDVLIFKAIESLKKAKAYSESKNDELKQKHLVNAVQLLKKTSDMLSDETIADCVNAILQLGYYSTAIQFLLDIANTAELVKLASQYENDVQLAMPIDPLKRKSYQKKLKLYHIIFQILVDVDKKALTSVEQAADNTLIGQNITGLDSSRNGLPAFVDNEGCLVTYYSQMRDECYKICLNSNDRMFHFEFYKWCVANGVGEKLLYIDTPYILEFLQSKASGDLEMSKLLWVYYSKKGDYYGAANQLYKLALSRFDITLKDRINFLSTANNFIHIIETESLKRDTMGLASQISDLIAVSDLQDELLTTILNDSRVSQSAAKVAQKKLGGEILPINDLYNEFIDPLGYYELALVSFKLAEHRNSDDVLSKWESLFDKWITEFKEKNGDDEQLVVTLCNEFTIVADRLKDTDSLFPMINLLEMLITKSYKNLKNKKALSNGVIIDAFVKSNVSYSKIYYNLRRLIESTTYDLFDGYSEILQKEMIYLIQNWYKNDRQLREVIPLEKIQNLESYSIDKDPIYKSIGVSNH
ncbi:hypothetical protein CANINC_002617 [Pichia inconspicua]|uniref:Nucleoporin Nup133/Nup155-like N-terminal domain-containing protein n=1 Tax=Pichia inconspicua TaxID=52247 RepID=A0A4T0X0R1_9ASCO|nr:hypothetical protein CANINC_002617 [[Candida] inconspicua]